MYVRFRYSEKATKFGKKSHNSFEVSKYISNMMGDFFKFCGLLSISKVYKES